jgi:hypothetical protein
MTYLKHALIAAVAFGGLALGSSSALAVPNGLPSASAAVPSDVESVRWVCGPYRCGWAPYGYYGARPWGPGRGWRWRHWGYRHRW